VSSSVDSFPNDRKMYDRAVKIVLAKRRASAPFLEQHLLISHIRAIKLLDAMVAHGVIGALLANGERVVLLQRESCLLADCREI
jgi:DNA segregation ATPase FtsK/SpoIIIE-like protein